MFFHSQLYNAPSPFSSLFLLLPTSFLSRGEKKKAGGTGGLISHAGTPVKGRLFLFLKCKVRDPGGAISMLLTPFDAGQKALPEVREIMPIVRVEILLVDKKIHKRAMKSVGYVLFLHIRAFLQTPSVCEARIGRLRQQKKRTEAMLLFFSFMVEVTRFELAAPTSRT